MRPGVRILLWTYGIVSGIRFARPIGGSVGGLLTVVWSVSQGGVCGTFLAFILVPGPTEAKGSRQVLVALIGAPFLAIALDALTGNTSTFLLMARAAGIATVAWTLAGYPLGRLTVLRAVARSKHRLVQVGHPETAGERTETRRLLRLAVVPLLFSYAVAALMDPFINLPEATGVGDLFQRHLIILHGSLVVLAVASVVVVPGQWLFEAPRAHAYDSDTGVARPFGFPRFIDDFIEVGVFIGLVLNAFGEGLVLTNEGVIAAMTTLVYTVWFLLPVTLLPTLLYVRFRMQRDLDAFTEEATFDRVDHVRELDAGPPTPTRRWRCSPEAFMPRATHAPR